MRVPLNWSDVTFRVSVDEMLTTVAPFLPTLVTCANAPVAVSDTVALSPGLIKVRPPGWTLNRSLVHPRTTLSTKQVHTMVCP